MKKFLKKFALIIFTSIISILIVYTILFAFSLRLTSLAREVFYSIEKANHNSGRPAVILGDSVCNQVWTQKQDDEKFSHLACNQAINACGTYLLLRKYLENNPQTKEAYYVIIPQSLGNDFRLDFTYQYFVVPFVHGENLKFIEPETMQKLYAKFGKFFIENDYVKNLLFNNNLFMMEYLNYIKKQPEENYFHRLSPTAIIYLEKMRGLCEKHNVKFRVLPLPISDKKENHGWEQLEQDIKNNGFENIFSGFMKKIRYYPENYFRDGVHFKNEILDEHINEIRSFILE